MAQLTKGMYRRMGYLGDSDSDLFGIHWHQPRRSETRMGYNSGWYNRAGEWLGMGDLSEEDLLRISQELEEGELFIILSERDSDDQDAPGSDYVAERCLHLVAPDQVWLVTDEDHPALKPKDFVTKGTKLPVRVLARDEAKALIIAA